MLHEGDVGVRQCLRFEVSRRAARLGVRTFLGGGTKLAGQRVDRTGFQPSKVAEGKIHYHMARAVCPNSIVHIYLRRTKATSTRLRGCGSKVGDGSLSSFRSGGTSTPISRASFSLGVLCRSASVLTISGPTKVIARPAKVRCASDLSGLITNCFQRGGRRIYIHPIKQLSRRASKVIIFTRGRMTTSELRSMGSPYGVRGRCLTTMSNALPMSVPNI